MFGFFKKKGGEIPEEQQRQQRGAQEGQTRQDAAEVPQEFRALGQDFLPEELNILAVTGASGFGGGRSQGEKLWTASIGLTAWMEEDSPDIHQGGFRLVALADDRLMDYLRQRVPRDFIIKCRARLSVDGSRLLMLELPQPGFDPDLKAILEMCIRDRSWASLCACGPVPRSCWPGAGSSTGSSRWTSQCSTPWSGGCWGWGRRTSMSCSAP